MKILVKGGFKGKQNKPSHQLPYWCSIYLLGNL